MMSNKMLDSEGKELTWNKGYKYFGASKDLPGVRELFEPDPPKPLKKTRAEYMRYVDAHYFGYMDEEDGQVMPLEDEAERRAREEAIDNYKMDKELAAMKNSDDWDKDIYTEDQMVEENPEVVASITEGGDFKKPSEKSTKKADIKKENIEDKKVEEVESASGEKVVRAAHVPVPSQEEIKAAMLRKKKLELLQKFASETLSEQSLEAKILLGL